MGVGVLDSLRFMIAASKVTLQKGMATHSSILAWRIPWTEGLGGDHGVAKNQSRPSD